eukprot:5959543-Ditylum_brightwellii.AAC.1
MAGLNLFKLLDLKPYSKEDIQRLDVNSIIKELQQNPSSAAKKYPFPYIYDTYFPLQQAILLRAPFEQKRSIMRMDIVKDYQFTPFVILEHR